MPLLDFIWFYISHGLVGCDQDKPLAQSGCATINILMPGLAIRGTISFVLSTISRADFLNRGQNG